MPFVLAVKEASSAPVLTSNAARLARAALVRPSGLRAVPNCAADVDRAADHERGLADAVDPPRRERRVLEVRRPGARCRRPGGREGHHRTSTATDAPASTSGAGPRPLPPWGSIYSPWWLRNSNTLRVGIDLTAGPHWAHGGPHWRDMAARASASASALAVSSSKLR